MITASKVRRASTWLVLVLALPILARADDPSAAVKVREKAEPAKKAEVPTSPDVTKAPPCDDFIVIPLRVHVLRSETLPEVNCSLSDDDIRRIIEKANKVWSVAGIHFGLESIRREKAIGEEKFKLARDGGVTPPLNVYRVLAPEDSRKFDGQHVYYIHKFAVNGVFLGNKTSFVQETARLRPVPGGIDEPLPRVTAHELGHSLTLPHRQDKTNLLASGTSGTLLNAAEVKQVRAAAAKTTGSLSFLRLKELADSAKSKEDANLFETWIKSIKTLDK